MLGFVLLFAAVGALFAGLGIPLIQRRVKPNSLYGLRVAATFADDRVWFDANAHSGRDLALLGGLQMLLALLLPLVPSVNEMTYVLINVVAMLIGTLVTCVIGWTRANRMLSERRRMQSD
jgi:uncharacterized membrane protein